MTQSIPESPETPPVAVAATGRKRLLRALSLLLLVLLCINFIRLPSLAADDSHDRGSHMAFEWYALHHYQFGVDVIQNVGPLGYLQYPAEYSGLLPGRKLIFSISLGILLGILSHRALRYFQTPEKVLWIACLFLIPFAPQGEIDSYLYFLMLLAAHHLVMRRRYGNAWLLSAVVWIFMAMLCLMKTTNVAIAGLLLSIAAVCNVIDRRYRLILFDGFCFVAPLLLFWVLAGQQVANFLPFVRDTIAFTSGYNEAMIFTLDVDTRLICLAVCVLALFVLVNAFRLLHPLRNRTRLLLALYEAGCLFVIWKHGYVRADWVHIAHFWCFMLPAAPLLFLAHPPAAVETDPKTPHHSRIPIDWITTRRMNWIASAVAVILCFYVCWLGSFPFSWPWRQIKTNASFALNWHDRMNNLEAQLQANKRKNALPDLQTIVGNATIDQFGFLPGVMFLNDMNYDPRPMAITFAAYNQAIQQRNADFYRNPKTAPRFILIEPAMLDQRFIVQDDSLALLQILAHYQLKFEGANHHMVMVERLTQVEPVADFKLMQSLTIQPDQWLDVPNVKGFGTWCTVSIRPNLWGDVRSFFFRPSTVSIVLRQGQGQDYPFRFLTGEGSSGFLLVPIIMNVPDWLLTHNIKVDPRLCHLPVKQIKFTFDDASCWADDIDVTFWGLTFDLPPAQP